MALTNKSRTAIYSGLTDIIDEDAVEEMRLSCRSRGSFGGGSAGEVGPVAAQ
jgi:cysteine synthase